ncbi:hypothetical protein QN277_025199 [Acacia crassicarpa]|uniref:Uncharacterized protein n=1 Tax=Acacia crassicarpa TaxID=499986 RepID=A0AAE1JDP0_9FABA|nr:hypothetical protein QN277_025199 [Acacia crassicarpa]
MLRRIWVTLVLYFAGYKSRGKDSSLKPHISGDLIHDWWFGIQLNSHFMGIDLNLSGNSSLWLMLIQILVYLKSRTRFQREETVKEKIILVQEKNIPRLNELVRHLQEQNCNSVEAIKEQLMVLRLL